MINAEIYMYMVYIMGTAFYMWKKSPAWEMQAEDWLLHQASIQQESIYHVYMI